MTTPKTRRQFLQSSIALGSSALAARWLWACQASGIPALAVVGATNAPATAGTGANGSASQWTTGGTANMRLDYADPFGTSTGDTCTLTSELTVGPCHAETLMRQDITEGFTGLPTVLALRVVDATTCQPIANATVDIWHTNAAGYYSAYAKGTICNPGNDDAPKQHFCRGVQTTDANGRVSFHTVFPGWYSSRSIHIHFTVRIGDTAYVTSQLFFDDAFTDDIMTNHLDYKSRPKRDTNNTNDTVLPRTGQDAFIVETRRLDDGALMAWKTIAIKTA